MRPEDVRTLARLLPETVEGAHQGHPDFRAGGRIFATLWIEEEWLVLRFTPARQAALVEAEPDAFELVEGAWGRRGWTRLVLDEADEATVRAALLEAWSLVAQAAYDRIE